jgi:hypothetical protein
LVLEWSTGFLAMLMALVISHMRVHGNTHQSNSACMWSRAPGSNN